MRLDLRTQLRNEMRSPSIDVLWMPDTLWNLLQIIVGDTTTRLHARTYKSLSHWLLSTDSDRVELKSFASFPVLVEARWMLDRLEEVLEYSATMRDAIGSTYQEPPFINQERQWIAECVKLEDDRMFKNGIRTCRSVLLSFVKAEISAYNTYGT
jgi:hypothetical protein